MALARLDYQQPDYTGGVGEALAGAAKTVDAYSPAPEFIQRFAKHGLSNKMDPREAAILAQLVHQGHIPDPTVQQLPESGAQASQQPQAPSSFSQPGGDYGNAWRGLGSTQQQTPQQQAPELPVLKGTIQSSMPRLVGRVEDDTGNVGMTGSMHSEPRNAGMTGSMESGPQNTGMTGSMRSSMGSATGGDWTGPKEFTSEELVRAPDLMTAFPRPDRPMMSQPSVAPRQMQAQAPQLPEASEDDPTGGQPIRNKDVPMLMQAASQTQKHSPLGDYLRMEQLRQGQEKINQGGTRITNQADQFKQLQPGRDARTAGTLAQTANIPFKNEMAKGNLGARWASVATGQGNLAARENDAYLKGTNDVAAPIAQVDGLLAAVAAHPEIAPPAGDFRVRRETEILDNIYGGKPLATAMRTMADWELTQQQRDWRRQAKTALMPYQHMMVGSQITAPEMALVNTLAGEQIGIDDMIAGLGALNKSMKSRLARYKAGFPAAAARIPDVRPGDMTQNFQSEADPNTGRVPDFSFFQQGPVPLIGDPPLLPEGR